MSDAHATPSADEHEIERLRERVTFYESFDRLIQENIARSGDLLRQAVEMRENAEREMAQARATATRELTAERERYRQTLAGLLGEVTRLQQQVTRLEQRLSESLDTLDTERPAEPSEPPAPAPEPTPTPAAKPADLPGEADQAAPTTATIAAPEPATAPETPSEPATAPEAPSEPEAATPETVPVATESAPMPAPAASTPEAPSALAPPPAATTAPPAPSAPPEAPAGPRAVTVLVHGVPRAATALSLQRHLARLDPVEGVEAREYAEGVLRLQVMTHRPLRPDDLEGWEGAAGLTPLNVLDDVLEVRLPGPEGL